MGPTPQRPFRRAYLRKYSKEHLWYEVWMFFQTGMVLLQAGEALARVEIIKNGMIESFAIHLRNLLDFFYPDPRHKPRPDDVIAAYYFDAGELPPNFPHKSKRLNRAEVRAHKEVSHLTTKRFWKARKKKGWKTYPLMRDVAIRLTAFVKTASADRLAPEFIEWTRIYRQSIERRPTPNPTTARKPTGC